MELYTRTPPNTKSGVTPGVQPRADGRLPRVLADSSMASDSVWHSRAKTVDRDVHHASGRDRRVRVRLEPQGGQRRHVHRDVGRLALPLALMGSDHLGLAGLLPPAVTVEVG